MSSRSTQEGSLIRLSCFCKGTSVSIALFTPLRLAAFSALASPVSFIDRAPAAPPASAGGASTKAVDRITSRIFSNDAPRTRFIKLVSMPIEMMADPKPGTVHFEHSFAEYSPLNANQKEFRLLDLYPGKFEGRIRCSTRRASLGGHTKPEYETISYCWGDVNERASIKLNGQNVSVPASAAAALRRVRMSKRNRVVWVDAVCIDQRNKEERGHQVTMMSDVYRSSTGILVYLGEGDAKVSAAVKHIQVAHDKIRDRADGFGVLSRTIAEFARTPVAEPLTDVFGSRWIEESDTLISFYSLPWIRLGTSHSSNWRAGDDTYCDTVAFGCSRKQHWLLTTYALWLRCDSISWNRYESPAGFTMGT